MLVACAMCSVAQAAIETAESGDFLLIGMGPGSEGKAIDISSGQELGQINEFDLPNKPYPTSSAPWPLPSNAQSVSTGYMQGGNLAITHSTGKFGLSSSGRISATPGIGIQAANTNPKDGVDADWKISFTGNGTNFQSIDNGLTTGANLSALTTEIGSNRTYVAGLSAGDYTGTIDLSSDGKIDSDRTDTFGSGQHIIHIDTGGSDFLLDNAQWVIDGQSDTKVILVFDEAGKNFKISNGNILAGTGGIGLDDILFVAYDDSGASGTKFDFSNSIVNGVSFWDLSDQNNQIGLNNVHGCTQIIGDRLDNFNDIRLKHCGYEGTEPDPDPPLVPEAASLVVWMLLGCSACLPRRRNP